MSVLADIKDLGGKHVTFTLVTIAATVAPGTLILFHFQRPLFTTLDWFRFTLLALSLPLPSLLWNCGLTSLIVQARMRETGRNEEPIGEKCYILACFLCGISYAISLLLAYALKLSFLTFACLVAACHLTLTLFTAVSRRAKR